MENQQKQCQVLCQDLFPSGNSPMVFSQVATSQKFNFPFGNFPSLSKPQHSAPQPILHAPFGSLAHPSRSARPKCSLRRLRGPNLTFLEDAALEIEHLESCHSGSCPWENAFGKVPYTIEPWRTNRKHGEPIETRENQWKPWRTNINHGKQIETIETRQKPGRTNINHREPIETRENQYKPQRTNRNHRELTETKKKQCLVFYVQFLVSSILVPMYSFKWQNAYFLVFSVCSLL